MQQPQGEVQWQTMTDNPLSDKGMDKTMGERLALLRRRLGLVSGWPHDPGHALRRGPAAVE